MDQATLESKLIETYKNNLFFLEHTQPETYTKITALMNAIENGYYTQKYELKYNNNYFDVIDLQNNTYLYSSNSELYANTAADSINYTKNDHTYETFYNLDIDDAYAEELEQEDVANNSYAPAAKLINYANKYANKNTTTMHKLYKFIFFGVGLGTHLLTIHQKLNSHIYYIIEDDLELFRLSLFITDYKSLTNNGATLYFSIFNERDDFSRITKKFLIDQFIYNHYIKFFHMLHHSNEKIKQFQNNIVTQGHLTYSHAALMTSLLRPLDYASKKYKFLNLTALYDQTYISKKPLLLIGAGPSFGNNIEWIEKNHNKFIIAIVSPLMSKFEALNIRPDIITHVHGYEDALPHIEKVKDLSFFDKTISLFGSNSYPDFVEYFKKENIYIFEGSSRYKEHFGGVTSSNIGAISYGLMLILRIKELFLLGLDFAPDQESGFTHSASHAHTKSLELVSDNNLKDKIGFREEILEVEGNFLPIVKTSLILNKMKDECNFIANSYKKDDNTIYNLSTNGAKLNNVAPLKFDDDIFNSLNVLEQDQTYIELKKLFDANSQNHLTKKEMHKLSLRVDYYDTLIQKLQEHQNKKYATIDEYQIQLINTFFNLLTDADDSLNSSEMNYLLNLYMNFVSGYIFDLINTREILDKNKLIEDLDVMVIPQMIRVIHSFRETVNSHIK